VEIIGLSIDEETLNKIKKIEVKARIFFD